MGKILIIDNDSSWGDAIRDKLVDVLHETPEFITLYPSIHTVQSAVEEIDFNEIDVVITDLEFKQYLENGPADKTGRDVVLKTIRSNAPWVPVILTSVYLKDAFLQADMTADDFDAVMHKEFFESDAMRAKHWHSLYESVVLKRIGVLTGRGMIEMREAHDMSILVNYGLGVSEALPNYDKEDVENLLGLAGLGESVTLDELVQGHSGLPVFKATCNRMGRKYRWLIKLGRSIHKLQREIHRHRQMYVDGLTRRMTVPPLWWNTVVWRSMGLIAYEFQDGAKTFLEKVHDDGAKQAISALSTLFEKLYTGSAGDLVIPRDAVCDLLSRRAKEEVVIGDCRSLAAYVEPRKEKSIDDSVEILLGSQHGDLHGRNILVPEDGSPVLIDFAHYRGTAERGIPLLDIAKLLVDIWVFEEQFCDLADLADGQVLAGEELAPLRGSILVNPEMGPSESERRFFGIAAQCEMANYAVYDDVPEDREPTLRRFLACTDDS